MLYETGCDSGMAKVGGDDDKDVLESFAFLLLWLHPALEMHA